MQANWKTSTGKKITLETSVIGETSRDHIHTSYKMSIDGKPVKVQRRTVKAGKKVLEFFFRGSAQLYAVVITDTVNNAIAAELEAVKSAVAGKEVVISQYDIDYENMARYMSGRNN